MRATTWLWNVVADSYKLIAAYVWALIADIGM